MHFYTKYTKEKIKIASKPFASGGEGALYHVVSPRQYKHLIAKIYYPEKRSPLRENKITYLIQHPPIPISQKQHAPIGWPVDTLYDNEKDFIGFLLPLLQGNKLTILTSSKLPRRIDTAWLRFSLKNKDSFKLRLRLCFNIASTLYQIHNSQNYVLVDLKPDNILVQANGLISIVDMDSVEIIEDNNVLFPAPVATPEYTPPEKYTIERSISTPVHESWDRFSMAVIFYQLLFGLHPFAASAKAPYDKLVGLDDKIRYGLFVHNPDIQEHFATIPPPHRRFNEIDSLLKDLFLECFVLGHTHADSRPTAEDWCAYLISALNLPIQLSGINAITKTAQNYKLPSSLVKLDKLPKIASRFVQHLKLGKPNKFMTREVALVPAQNLTNLQKLVPNTKFLELEQLQNHDHTNLPKVPTPDWLTKDFILPYEIEAKEKKYFQFVVGVLMVGSLGFLSFGFWLSALLFALPGLALFTFIQNKKFKSLLAAQTALEQWTKEKMSLEEQKENITQQKENIQQIVLNLSKEHQHAFPAPVAQYFQKIDTYEQELNGFDAFIQEQDTKAQATRKNERQAYQELRKIYADKIKAHPDLAPFRSTAHNYLAHQINYKIELAKKNIEATQAIIAEEKKNFATAQKMLKDKFEHKESTLIKQFNMQLQKNIAEVNPTRIKTTYKKRFQELKTNLKQTVEKEQTLIEEKIVPQIEKLLLDKQKKLIEDNNNNNNENELNIRINTELKNLKKAKENSKLFKKLNINFKEELFNPPTVQLLDQFQLPVLDLKHQVVITESIDPDILLLQLTNYVDKINDLLFDFQKNWTNLTKELKTLHKKLRHNQAELRRQQQPSLSVEKQRIKEVNKALIGEANIAQNFDLIFKNQTMTPEQEQDLLTQLDNYGLVSILELKEIDVIHNNFIYNNGVVLSCAKLQTEELQALKDFWDYIHLKKDSLIQALEEEDLLLVASQSEKMLFQEIKELKSQIIKKLNNYQTTTAQNLDTLKELYIKQEYLAKQIQQAKKSIFQAEKALRLQEIKRLEKQIELHWKDIREQQQQIAQEKEEHYQSKLALLQKEEKKKLNNLEQEKLKLTKQFTQEKIAQENILKQKFLEEKNNLDQTFEKELLTHLDNIEQQQQLIKRYKKSLSFLEEEHNKLKENIKQKIQDFEDYYSNLQKETSDKYDNLRLLSIYLKNRLPKVKEYIDVSDARLEKLDSLLEQYQDLQLQYEEIQLQIANKETLQTWYDNL